MSRNAMLLSASLLAVGCTPTLTMNRSFLVPEELRVSRTGYASLKSTGETFDLTPIKAQEPGMGDQVLVLEVHGSYLLVGNGWKKLWRVWPAGKDEAKYKPVEVATGPGGFSSPSIEVSGKCGLVKWQKSGAPAQAFITADGDVDEKKCGDE